VNIIDGTCAVVDPAPSETLRRPRTLPLSAVRLLKSHQFSPGYAKTDLDQLSTQATRVLALWRLEARQNCPAEWTTAYYPAKTLCSRQQHAIENRVRGEGRSRGIPGNSVARNVRVEFDYGDEAAGPNGRKIPLHVKIPNIGSIPGVITPPPPKFSQIITPQDLIPSESKAGSEDGQNEAQNALTPVARVWKGFEEYTKRYKVHVGARVAVFWPKEGRFFAGKVERRAAKGKGWVVKYDHDNIRTHRFKADGWRYLMNPTRRHKCKFPSGQTSSRKRQRVQIVKPIKTLLKRPLPTSLADLGLEVREGILEENLLIEVEKVCRDLLDSSYSHKGPPSSRTRGNSASGAGVSNCIGQSEGCSNGLQLYVTRKGGSPLWNRDSVAPERWVQTVNHTVKLYHRPFSTPPQHSNSPDTPSHYPSLIHPSPQNHRNSAPSRNQRSTLIPGRREERKDLRLNNVLGDAPRSKGFQKPTKGVLSIRFCNRVISGDYCVHCRQPAAKPRQDQWDVLMRVAQKVSNLGLIPSRKVVNGIRCRAKLLAFTVLDYGYYKALKKPTPGIPLHQDTSCLGEAIGSLHVAGETKNIDLLFDEVPLNGAMKGRVASFAHTANSFYVMKDQSRWLARHRVQTTKSLGLLLRVKWVPEDQLEARAAMGGGILSSGEDAEKEPEPIGSNSLERLIQKYRKRRDLQASNEQDRAMWFPDPS